jgi:hypothetical protein
MKAHSQFYIFQSTTYQANAAAKANAKNAPWWMQLISALPGAMLTKNAMKPVVTKSG